MGVGMHVLLSFIALTGTIMIFGSLGVLLRRFISYVKSDWLWMF